MSVLDKILSGIVFVIAMVFVWGVCRLIDELEFLCRRRRFRTDLMGALDESQPVWAEVCDIAELCNITKQDAFQEVKKLLRNVIVGREGKDRLKPHRGLLEAYMVEYRAEEPFEGLPGNTRLSLERLRRELGGNSDVLHPLTNHFKELLQIHDAINRRQRAYTVGGFVIGVVGLAFGIYAWYYPVSG